MFIGLIFHALNTAGGGSIQVGIVHVLERVAYHQSHLPLRNLVLQFVGATISLVSGHSVGREGPGVHLGTASSSLLGQSLHLPNNSIQTLVACGAAASFNTPLAGALTGLCALIVPEIMGVGYDTVNQAMLGQIGLGVLFMVVLFKMLATTIGLGMGLPGGLIGPTLIIGAAAGGIAKFLRHAWHGCNDGCHITSTARRTAGHAGADRQSEYYFTRYASCSGIRHCQQSFVWA